MDYEHQAWKEKWKLDVVSSVSSPHSSVVVPSLLSCSRPPPPGFSNSAALALNMPLPVFNTLPTQADDLVDSILDSIDDEDLDQKERREREQQLKLAGQDQKEESVWPLSVSQCWSSSSLFDSSSVAAPQGLSQHAQNNHFIYSHAFQHHNQHTFQHDKEELIYDSFTPSNPGFTSYLPSLPTSFPFPSSLTPPLPLTHTFNNNQQSNTPAFPRAHRRRKKKMLYNEDFVLSATTVVSINGADLLHTPPCAATAEGSEQPPPPAPTHPTLLDLHQRQEYAGCASFTVQHGSYLPALEVRYISDLSACHMSIDALTGEMVRGESLVNSALEWLIESIEADDPIIGVDAEGRQIHLLQLSTQSRCVLIRIPPYVSTSNSTSSPTTPTLPSHITIPSLLRMVLSDHTIAKSGAEMWGDALDIFRDLGIAMNNGLNITRSFPQPLSLEHMTNIALCGDAMTQGAWAFKKDKVSTTSDWQAEVLSLRQLVYGALDAQTSYFIGKRLARPEPFFLESMSQPWLEQAGTWLLMSKFIERQQEKEFRASFEELEFTDSGLCLYMNQYNTRIRLGSDVTVHLTDGTKVSCLVIGVNGKKAELAWERAEDVLGKEDVDIERITLSRKFEENILPSPVKAYLQDNIHASDEGHPIVNTLLSYFYDGPSVADNSKQLPAHSRGNESQQLDSSILSHPWIAHLNESQQYAVWLALNSAMCTVQGPPGSGKTSTIAAVVRELIYQQPGVRILVVARTNTAARHCCSAIAQYLNPTELSLYVSQEFMKEWHEEQYTSLKHDGFLVQDYDGIPRSHQVLVMTTGLCFTKPNLLTGRTVVILDESSQIWDLEAILFLRAMDSLQRLIMFGDSKQLSCFVAADWKVSTNSILDLANCAAARARLFPREWQATGLLTVQQCMLNVQYRMCQHIGQMISSLFYNNLLRSYDTSHTRAVEWRDIRGFAQADENDQFSVSNSAEVDEIIRLWRHLCSHGYNADEIVVISMYESQRQKLAQTGVINTSRIYNVDSFQGQESPIVILTLANNIVTDFLRDARRANVACSRAQQRLYIVGNLSVFSTSEAGCWEKIAKYSLSDFKPSLDLPELTDHEFPTLQGNGAPMKAKRSWLDKYATKKAKQHPKYAHQAQHAHPHAHAHHSAHQQQHPHHNHTHYSSHQSAQQSAQAHSNSRPHSRKQSPSSNHNGSSAAASSSLFNRLSASAHMFQPEPSMNGNGTAPAPAKAKTQLTASAAPFVPSAASIVRMASAATTQQQQFNATPNKSSNVKAPIPLSSTSASMIAPIPRAASSSPSQQNSSSVPRVPPVSTPSPPPPVILPNLPKSTSSPISLNRNAPSKSKKSKQEEKDLSWVCHLCTFHNQFAQYVCEMCEVKRA